MNGREYPAFTADNAPKAGGKVIMIGNGQDPERVLTVKKVTPTGLVKTEEGLTYRLIGDGRYTQRGSGWIGAEQFIFTEIIPYTDTLAEQAHEYQRKRGEEQARQQTIDDAREVCRAMADNGNALPYEAAVKILGIYKSLKEA